MRMSPLRIALNRPSPNIVPASPHRVQPAPRRVARMPRPEVIATHPTPALKIISPAQSPRVSRWLFLLAHLAARTTAPATALGETIRILSIGNSFSENSLRHLPLLAASQGVEIIVGEANMPGASLKRHASHWRAAQLNADSAEGKPYRDRRNPSAPQQSLAERLQADTWDYVTIQQFSQESFRPETYEPWAGEIVAAIRRYAPQARILVHQTWAYRDDHPWFAAKTPDANAPSLHTTPSGEFLTPATMHAGLRAAYDELAARYGFTVVPVGDAFHLARQMPLWQVQFPDPTFDYENPPADARPNEPGSLFVGWLWRKAANAPAATFTLDATHANVAGEYLGACVFFETLTGRDVLSVTWHPAPLTDEQAASLRTAAHAAARPSLSPNSSSAPPPADAPAAPRREVSWNNPPTEPHRLVSHKELASQALQRTVGYTVYLPPSYASESERRYPVLYFLHGAGGNENADGPAFAGIVDRLVRAGRIPPVVCVFPNGGLSGYRNHPETGLNVETMIIEELLPLIDANYRTLAQRESRVIAGFSMGGGGALRLALSHPHLFSAASSWAGAMTNRRTNQLPPELDVAGLSAQEPTVRLLLITGYDDKSTHAGHWTLIERLKEARYPFTLRTLRGVGHNLGRYYELTGEEFATFLLRDIALAPKT